MYHLHRFLLLLFILFPLFLFSQDLNRRITISATQKKIPEILEEIQAKSGIIFSYNPRVIQVSRLVTINMTNETIQRILDEILIKNGIQYHVIENQVVLKSAINPDEPETRKSAQKPAHFTVSGFLYDKASREALIGANVSIKGTGTGTISNGYGFFSLTLPSGKYDLLFSYLGFRDEERMVNLTGNLRMNIEMDEKKVEIREVEILSGTGTGNNLFASSGSFSFNRTSLGKLPGFGGDLDIIRAIQTVPGIQTFGDGSSLYYVRGGNSDQNLLLIDETPVFNPSHLFGFFSAFAPDAINNVEVCKGAFPAKYGGRLSSVIDIKARDGNMKRFGVSGNIGPYATSFTLEGPVIREKSSFIVSGRISTLNWLSNLEFFDHSFGFQFFDINAKFNMLVGNSDRFFLTFYYGLDELSRYNSVDINSYGIGWNNLAVTGRWYHVFNHRFFSNTTVSYAQYRYSLNLPQETNGFWRSSVSGFSVKSDLTWYLNPSNTVKSGLQVVFHNTDPGNVTVENSSTSGNLPEVSKYQGMEYVAYLSNEQKIGTKWSLRYGIRLPVWQDWGKTKVYYFTQEHKVYDTVEFGAGESYSTAFSPEPRVQVQYQPLKALAVSAGYSRNTQFLQLLSNSVSPFTSLEVWVPCGPNIPPQVSDQVEGGVSCEFDKTNIVLSSEVYYKWFRDRLDYKDHPNLLFNTLIEGELRFGSGRSYGIETMVRKTTGNLTGWIGYTYSVAEITTAGINQNLYYPATYDRPHNFCINIAYEVHRRWQFSANWIFMSGGAVTMPVGFYHNNGYIVPIYGDRNNARLPDYHRLDLMAAYNFNKPGNRYHHSVTLTVYNVYNRMNPFSLNFNKMMNDQGQYVVPSNLYTSNIMIPTWFSVAGIIPSLNYKFRF